MPVQILTIPETIMLGMRQEDITLVPRPLSPLRAAADHLRKRGHSVEPVSGIVPGLWFFNGREITSGQLLHVASEIA